MYHSFVFHKLINDVKGILSLWIGNISLSYHTLRSVYTKTHVKADTMFL